MVSEVFLIENMRDVLVVSGVLGNILIAHEQVPLVIPPLVDFILRVLPYILILYILKLHELCNDLVRVFNLVDSAHNSGL